MTISTGCPSFIWFLPTLHSVLPKLESAKPQKIGFLPAASDSKEAQFLKVAICPISQIWVLLSSNVTKITQLGKKQLYCWLLHEVDNRYWLLSEETGKFEEKRATMGRQIKSRPILGLHPTVFLTRCRRFQSSLIQWVNRGVGNTDFTVH